MLTALPLDSIICDLFFQGAHYFLFLGNLQTGRVRWSENAVVPLCLDGVETTSAVWEQLLRPEDAATLRTAMAQVSAGTRAQFQEDFTLSISGVRTCARFQLWSLADQGEPERCAGIITDLTPELTGATAVAGLRSGSELLRDLTALVERQSPCGLLVLSPDSFRRISEQYSHAFGDVVLQTLATRLEALMPPGTPLYRLDGDGFAAVLPNATPESALAQFSRCQELTLQPLPVKETSVSLTLSGAACFYPKDGDTAEELLTCVRFALNVGRKGGGNQFVAYSKELSEKTRRELLLLEKLRESVSRAFAGFSLKYQPLILAESGALYGCEVLLRWQHAAFPEEVTPYEFVPLLERSGLMPKVGAWVIREALHQCAKWVRHMPNFQMSINVTYEQFQDPEFRFFVMDCLCREKLNPGLLTLELTESNDITDTETISQSFDFFRSQGIKMAFDDFGMGYASLDIFRLLSADELKIDRSFLNRLTYDVTDQKIIAHLISLCDSINMNVCVEGVETQEVMNIVQQLKPMLLQGYYYNKPLTAMDFEQYYFLDRAAPTQPAPTPVDGSLVYSELRPAQAMTGQELVDTAHAGIFQVGMDHSFTFLTCNEGYRKMLGYTAKEVEEKFKNHALGFVHPDDAAYVNEEIRRQLGMGDTVTIEFRIVRADGSPLWILGTGNVVRSKNGSSSLSVVILDNDRCKRHALQIEQDYRQYKRILSDIPAGVKCVRFDEEFTLDYISPPFLALLGYSEGDIATKFHGKYLNLIYEEDQVKVFNDIFEQKKTSNIITLRYRSPCKDGRLIWVETVSRLCPPEEDGIQRCYSCVVDVTDSITDAEKSRAASLANRYQEAATQWGDVLFACDFRTDVITYSDNFASVFGRQPSPDTGALLEMAHPDDRAFLARTLQNLRSGQTIPPIEVRALFGDNTYHWCAVYFNEAEMVGKTALSAVGKVRDINEERLERDRLMAQAQLDPLTGLLNKHTLEERIRLTLSAERSWPQGALFMVDIDNFKQINDHMGHPCGDHLLRDVAERLRSLFAEGDLLGRAGGDEFMALMRLDADHASPAEQCERMLTAMSFPFYYGDKEIDVSFSVGVSLFPAHGRHFYDLFRRADGALYRAKELGKNRYCLAT